MCNMHFLGRLHKNFTFTNCSFEMTSGSKIYVAQGKTVTFNGCKLAGDCLNMWYGIQLTDKSNLKLDKCQIEDAIYAVSTIKSLPFGNPAPVTLSVKNSTFNRNHVGIYKGTGQPDYKVPLNSFDNNDFSQIAPMASLPTNVNTTNTNNNPALVSFDTPAWINSNLFCHYLGLAAFELYDSSASFECQDDIDADGDGEQDNLNHETVVYQLRFGFKLSGSKTNIKIKNVTFFQMDGGDKACDHALPNSPYWYANFENYNTFWRFGTGIKTNLGTVRVDRCTFKLLSSDGIFANSTTLSVKNSIFKAGYKNAIYGVQSIFALPNSYDIANNKIILETTFFPPTNVTVAMLDIVYHGINIERPAVASNPLFSVVNIRNNTFHSTPPGTGNLANLRSTQCKIDAGLNNSTSPLIILNNTFKHENQIVQACLYLTGTYGFLQKNLSIRDNVFNFNTTQGQSPTIGIQKSGIKFDRVNGGPVSLPQESTNVVSGNKFNLMVVGGTQEITDNQSCILGVNTKAICYSDNTFNGSTYGLRLLGDNGPTSMFKNTIINHKNGFDLKHEYTGLATVVQNIAYGDQKNKGNTWTGTYVNGTGAFLTQAPMVSGFANTSAFKKFYVNTLYPNNLPANNGPELFFVINGQTNTSICWEPEPLSLFSADDIDIATGNYPQEYLLADNEWYADMGLLYKILEVGTAGNPIMADFEQRLFGSSQYQYAEFLHDFHNAIVADPIVVAAIYHIESEIESLLLQREGLLAQNESVFQTTGSYDPNLDAQIEQLDLNLQTAETTLATLTTQIQVGTEANVRALEATLRNLPTQSLPMVLLKKVMTTDLLTYLGQSPYTESVQNELEGIATNSPGIVGIAHYWAATRLSGCHLDHYQRLWSNWQDPIANPALKVGMSQTGVSIFPNPTGDRFTCSVPNQHIVRVTIYSATGSVLEQIESQDNKDTAEFSTLPWPNGVYWVAIQIDNGSIKTAPVVVNH
jgi:Secretion system C-terminal sorting domain